MLYNYIWEHFGASENGQYCSANFYDLPPAFDTVNHRILIEKLEYYAIRGI